MSFVSVSYPRAGTAAVSSVPGPHLETHTRFRATSMGDETADPRATTPYTDRRRRALPRMPSDAPCRLVFGHDAFPVDGAGDREYREYLSGVVATAFIPLGVVLVFMIPFYWMFLCY